MRSLSGVWLAAVAAAVVAAGCGGTDGPLTVEQALGRDGEATVEGFLVAPAGGPARLCSALLESYPPQCGEPSIAVEGLNLASLPGLVHTNDPSLAQVTWSESAVPLNGSLADGVLTASGS